MAPDNSTTGASTPSSAISSRTRSGSSVGMEKSVRTTSGVRLASAAINSGSVWTRRRSSV
jgi:hypothetical protein